MNVSRLSRITTFLAVFSFSPFPLSILTPNHEPHPRIHFRGVKYFTHLPLDKKFGSSQFSVGHTIYSGIN